MIHRNLKNMTAVQSAIFHVFVVFPYEYKPLITSFALEWLFSSVGSFMSLQILFPSKPLVTSFALVWFLSSVGSYMHL